MQLYMFQRTIIATLCCYMSLSAPGHSAPAPPAYPATPEGRLSLADEWGAYSSRGEEGPGSYAFGYDVEDTDSGNVQFRSEQRHSNGTVTGSFGFLDAAGVVHVTHYVADGAGFRSKIEKITSKNQHPSAPVEVHGNYYNTPGFPLQGLSLEALSAAASLDTFKGQKVHDQRTRPKDHEYHAYYPQLFHQGPLLFKNYNK